MRAPGGGSGAVRRRGAIGAGLLLLWTAAMALLARREVLGEGGDALADAAVRLVPSSTFYVIEQGGAPIGFASSTVDTTPTGVVLREQLMADVGVGGKRHRASASSTTDLSRVLAMRSFDVQVKTESGTIAVNGRAVRDSLLVVVRAGDAPPDTQRLGGGRPVLLPTAIPLLATRGRAPEPGRRVSVRVFDPLAMGPRDVELRVGRDSLFVVSDSAEMDEVTRRWRAVAEDTVRAWRLAADSGEAGFAAWVDGDGRLMRLEQPGGIVLRRDAFHVAFTNWRDAERSTAADDDVLETTAISASAPLRGKRLDRLAVRLRGVSLAGFALAGGRQRVSGDTLVVERERDRALRAYYVLPGAATFRAHHARELSPEPLLQSTHPGIAALAARLAGGSRDPRVVAERINRWVHDSVRKSITVGVPDALQVLSARRGDCNEHTQLYLALARAAGVPARGASGLAYLNGKFYFHAWPEVYLGSWVAVDPTFGQFPADAAHLRFATGGLDKQTALLRLIGRLEIDVLDSHREP